MLLSLPLEALNRGIGRWPQDHARLHRLLPDLLFAPPPVTDRVILCHLIRAIRRERRRGIDGHWSYSLDRHLALVQWLRTILAARGRRRAPASVHGAFSGGGV